MTKIEKHSIVRIVAGDEPLFLYYNTKRPYWKKKPLGIVMPGTFVVWEMEIMQIDIDNLYYKKGRGKDLCLLHEYEGFKYI